MSFKSSLPKEIVSYIFLLANNECHTCLIKCNIPYKKLDKMYFCCDICYNFIN